jgi:hypothetical protein
MGQGAGGQGGKTPGAQKAVTDDRADPSNVSDTKADPPRFGASVEERRSATWIWIAIGVILLGVAAVAVLYYFGVIK